MLALLFSLLLANASSAVASSGSTLSFSEHGAPVAHLSLADVKAISAVRELSIRDPHADAPRSVSAVSLVPLLDHLYGARWRSSGGVVFRGADGYEAQVAVERLIRLHADLAFAFSDGSPFTMSSRKHGGAVIPLGPFRLVWEDAPKDAHGEGAMWPYQVISIDLEPVAPK